MYDDAKQLSEITLLAFLTYRNSISAVTETRQSPEMEKIYFFSLIIQDWSVGMHFSNQLFIKWK